MMFELPINLNNMFRRISGESQSGAIRSLLFTDPASNKTSIDGFIDLIVYAYPGEFIYDYDFGFCFWNDVYNNISIDQFNNSEYPKKKYTDSLTSVINKYEKRLEDVKVDMLISDKQFLISSITVKFTVHITISGFIKGLKKQPYQRHIIFSIGPTIRM